MTIARNLSTPENRKFWQSLEDTAHEVTHWLVREGGDGLTPDECPRCQQDIKNGVPVYLSALYRLIDQMTDSDRVDLVNIIHKKRARRMAASYDMRVGK